LFLCVKAAVAIYDLYYFTKLSLKRGILQFMMARRQKLCLPLIECYTINVWDLCWSACGGGEWSASMPHHFTFRERAKRIL
jgi:hypothetical protein